METVFERQKSNNLETRLKEISSDLFAVYLFIPHKTTCAWWPRFGPYLHEDTTAMMYYEIIFEKKNQEQLL